MSKPSLRRITTTSAIVGALALLAACGNSGPTGAQADADGLQQVTFRLDWTITGEHAHFYAAVENGYFKDEGLDVKILEGSGSAAALQQVAREQVDFGLASFDALAGSRAEGLPAVMVANLFRRTPHMLLTLTDNNIDEPSDLRGRTVGAAAGSSPANLFPAYLEAAGISKDDVNIVNLDPASYIPALLEGRIDAFTGFAPSQYPILKSEAGDRTAGLYYADAGLVTVSTGVIATEDMVAENPALVESFVRGVQRGLDWTITNPDQAVDMMVNLFPRSVTEEQAEAAIEQVAIAAYGENTADLPVGQMSEDDVIATLDTLQRYGGLTSVEAPSAYYTNDFIDPGF